MKFSLVSLSLLLLIASCYGVQLNTRVRGKTAFEVCGEQPHDIIVSAELPIPSATGRHMVSGSRTYALPPNRVYVCNILTKNLGSDPRVIVFKNNEFVDTTGKIESSVFNAKTLDYLATLYADSEIPHQAFLWAVDPNYNLIVAPEYQPTGAGTSSSPKVIKTMKHGDLLPGFTPFQGPRPSRDDFGSLKERLVAGKFRGPAVMGGEFKELPSHAGWEINDASSYSILRVPLSDTALMYQRVNPPTSKFWASSSRHIDVITKAQLHNLVCALQAIGFDSKVEHVTNNVWDGTAKKFNQVLDDGGYAPAVSLVSKYCPVSHVSVFTGKPLHITYQTELH